MKLPEHKLRQVDYYQVSSEKKLLEIADIITIYWKPRIKRGWFFKREITPPPKKFSFNRTVQCKDDGTIIYHATYPYLQLYTQLMKYFKDDGGERIEEQIQNILDS